MLIELLTTCPDPRCQSIIKVSQRDAHVHYFERDHENDPVKPEIAHRVTPKKSGDSCRCGGMNPACDHCGGNGIVT